MIRAVDHDAAEPRNLHDWELYEGMTELPPSRPPSEETQVSYLITKAKLLRPLGAVVDVACSLHPNSYDVALQIDEQLSRAYLQIPPHLQMRDLEKSARDNSCVFDRGVQLHFLFHQGVCVLHRRFLRTSRLDVRFARSREQCINSAMALLNHQSILYEFAKKTDSVKAQYWFRVSCISQDFFLPAIILCLDLRYRKIGLLENASASFLKNDDNQQKAMSEALMTAYKIWMEVQDFSPETYRVFRVLCQLLEVLGADEKDRSLIPPTPSLATQGPATYNSGSSFDSKNDPSFTDMDIDWVSSQIPLFF